MNPDAHAPHPTASHSDLANAIRALAMDAVEAAQSGHPGMPMGMADIATVLWRETLVHDPADPGWRDRDRFVLSNGHGSLLLYAALHLSGYDLPLSQLKRFRQLHSQTPGHPEYGLTPGVETTTGPLGQGLGNAVGMALAEALLAAEFNRPGHAVVDHRTYVFVGDGCLMEGISHEAASLAGTLGLGKLVAFYDDNGISIDGEVKDWFTDDTAARFRAYGWNTIGPIDGHDPQAIRSALAQALSQSTRPTLILCRTVIGFGAPKRGGTAKAHGAPLGAEEIAAARVQLGWSHPPFVIPEAIYQAWDARAKGAERHADWRRRFAAYRQAHPQLAAEFERRQSGALPADWPQRLDDVFGTALTQSKPLATRKASEAVLNAIAPPLPELFGGSADLSESNNTRWNGAAVVKPGRLCGRYLHYGVREFGMVAAMNGLALHGGLIPYGGTFLVFSDYARNAIRLSALMRLRAIYVLTHDSIGLGEDGPTHQPIEHLASLRLIPHLDLWRPASLLETTVAWAQAIGRGDGPSALVLSRQNLPVLQHVPAHVQAIARGGYVLAEAEGAPQTVILATGSEVGLAVEAQALLAREGLPVRVVSMPSTSVFDRQPASYRESVLPRHLPAVAVEAAHPDLWRKYVGRSGAVIGIDRFGESAPGDQVMAQFGFTAEHVAAAVRQLGRDRRDRLAEEREPHIVCGYN
ncbi:MAG: transketolase [Gammaproteobacteria bacterium]|nr:transketolase [Gammaproteobacteria bacterium]